MSKAAIIEMKAVTMAELKEELDKAKKKTGEQGFRAQRTEEYLNTFVKIPAKKALELKDEIEKLNVPRLAENHIIKIINIMPETVEELKVVLQGYPITVTKENMAKIADVVKKFL
ncbi:hypothetical protein KY335_04880 [Candidatus Woesearchaeota archaeon]|nr:hypothetical protein [Candidatus Woesearchaeota archaeon]